MGTKDDLKQTIEMYAELEEKLEELVKNQKITNREELLIKKEINFVFDKLIIRHEKRGILEDMGGEIIEFEDLKRYEELIDRVEAEKKRAEAAELRNKELEAELARLKRGV